MARTRAADELPAGPNRSLVYGSCRSCHGLEYLTESAGIDRSQWASVLKTMRQLGMPALSDDDRHKILDYLGTYLGPHSPPKTAAGATSAPTQIASGQSLFKEQCATCHQPGGKGVPGQFPPLAGNADLFASHTFPVLVLLNGLQGAITVHGGTFNGQMPSFRYLSDAEVAALVNYVRGSWGNAELRPSGAAPVTSKEVADARGRTLSPQDVHAYRETHKQSD